MEVLPQTIQLLGLGRPVEAVQLKRKGLVCLYERDDEIYEVIIIKIKKAQEAFGNFYPEREVYPNSEDFGTIAWCFKSLSKAEKYFDKISRNRKFNKVLDKKTNSTKFVPNSISSNNKS